MSKIVYSEAVGSPTVVSPDSWRGENSWHLVCTCHSYEHQIHFNYDPDEKEVYCTIHLPDRPFWSRLWSGLKYIFGHKSNYGEFDSIILGKEHASAFIEIGNLLKQSTW